MICWKDLLLLLQGEPVKLPSPEDQFATDVCIKTDVLMFAISKAKIEFIEKHNMRDNRETEMMDVWWKEFEFHQRTPRHEQKSIIPCLISFAKLIFLGNSD